MEFNKVELALIAAAKKKSAEARVMRVLIIVATLFGLGLMLTGNLDANRFAYGAVVAVYLAIALPQFGAGPKFEDLVKLLERKAKPDDTL